MGLTTGSITSENPSSSFSDIFKTLIGGEGVANWSFIENIPAGTGDYQSGSSSYSCDIFKCAGSGEDANDCGNDWYIGIVRYDGNTSFYLLFAEEYDAENKKLKGWPHRNVGKAGVNYSKIENEYFVTNVWEDGDIYQSILLTQSYSTRPNYVLNTSGFNYWVYLDNDFVVISFKVGTTEYSCYVGLMDSLIDSSITDNIPLVMLSTHTNNSDAKGVLCRAPGASDYAGGTSRNGVAKLYTWTYNAMYNCVSLNTGFTDGFFNGGIHAARGFVAHDSSDSRLFGYTRGLLKEEIMIIPYYQAAIGDTISLTDTDATPDSWTIISGNIDNYRLLVRS